MIPLSSIHVIPSLRKMMLIFTALVALSLWLLGPNSYAHAQNWEIYFKGKPLVVPEGPIDRNGTILVPLRASMEPFGYKVDSLGNGAYRLIGGAIGSVDLKIGEKKAIYNTSVTEELKTAPVIINGTLFIDLDFTGVLTDIGTEKIAGKPIIELRASADIIDYDSQYWYAVQTAGTKGIHFVNKTGKTMLTTSYDGASDFGYGGLSAVYQQGVTVGYIDRKGKLTIQASHYRLSGFSEGLAPFKDLIKNQNGGLQVKYGYLNRAGKVVIPAAYDAGFDFSDGLAKVVKDGKTYYIDHDGRIAVGTIANSTHTVTFSEGLAAVSVLTKVGGKSVEKTGFIDTQGKFVIPPKFDTVGMFSEGLATAVVGKKTGYIDRTGKWVIEQKYENGFAHDFHEGLANVMVRTGEGSYRTDLVDKIGKTLALPITRDKSDVSEGIFAYRDGDQTDWRLGLMNIKGEIVAMPQFSSVEPFHAGVARARIDHGQGRYETVLVNKKGEIVWRSEPETAS